MLGVSFPHGLSLWIHVNIAMLIDLNCSEGRPFIMAQRVAGKSALANCMGKWNKTLELGNESLISGPVLSDLITNQQIQAQRQDVCPSVCPRAVADLPSSLCAPLAQRSQAASLTQLHPLCPLCERVAIVIPNVMKTCGSPKSCEKFAPSRQCVQ